MIKFSSKIFEDIVVEGLINLKVKRNFKWLKSFDLIFNQGEKHLLTISRTIELLKTRYTVLHNDTGFEITIENDKMITIGTDQLELKIDKLYPIKIKYADVLFNNQSVGEILFEKKLLGITLNFIPISNLDLNKDLALNIGMLIALNMVDLDGSE